LSQVLANFGRSRIHGLEAEGGERPMVAIYRKTQPMRLQVSLFIKHLVESFKHYNRSCQPGLI
jgi:Na+-transporting NADH:ubiquinone oxidoreductase subunit NqrA